MDWNWTYDEFGAGQRKDCFTFRASAAWVDERAEDQREAGPWSGPDRLLAFAMGAHNLLSGRSQIKTFNADILHTVAKIVIKNL